MYYSATYDPADDKLRLSATSRLDAETYARVKAAGFGWAPKQSVFYAVWSPSREDLMLELAGEIGDEDTTLVDRAEQRAQRFEGYSERRAEDANRAHAAVSAIADGIPFGQPILVGHHSERHARRDAEKIENGMRRAVRMWETSKYWESRAAGAIRHAKYKERPDVRARRIKGLEAERRSLIADYTPAYPDMPTILREPWNWKPSSRDLTDEQIIAEREAARVPHVWVGPKGRGGRWVPVASLERIKASNARSIAHIDNRLIYERAMLAEAGGLAAERFDIQVGGQILRRGDWMVVTKLNKCGDVLMSVSVIGHWATTVPVEEIKDYRPPVEGAAEKVAAVTKLAPLVNYRTEGCIEMTAAEWKTAQHCSGSYFADRISATETTGAHRMRTALRGGGMRRVPVFLTDAKVVRPPTASLIAPAPVVIETAPAELPDRSPFRQAEPTAFDAMREQLRAGVQVVAAPQLFPTPPELARRMVEVAAIEPGMCVLEPSAGTGSIVRAVVDSVDTEVLAYEINQQLCAGLSRSFPSYKVQVRCQDFLKVEDFIGCYPRVVMNPPFERGADIQHIRHAVKFLKPGGRLVAICANGPRQREQLMPLAEESGGWWEELPAGTFAEQGTGVNTALLVIEA